MGKSLFLPYMAHSFMTEAGHANVKTSCDYSHVCQIRNGCMKFICMSISNAGPCVLAVVKDHEYDYLT